MINYYAGNHVQTAISVINEKFRKLNLINLIYLYMGFERVKSKERIQANAGLFLYMGMVW